RVPSLASSRKAPRRALAGPNKSRQRETSAMILAMNFARGFAACLAALMWGGIGTASALDYPTRPVRWIVTYPPGRGTDLTWLLWGGIGTASALDSPARPVRWIVTYPPGGGTDITARIMAQWLSERLGQQFFIENKPGGGNNIGTEAAVPSSPDGYTLVLANPGH